MLLSNTMQRHLQKGRFLIQQYVKGDEYRIFFLLCTDGTAQWIPVTMQKWYVGQATHMKEVKLDATVCARLSDKLTTLSQHLPYDKLEKRYQWASADILVDQKDPYIIDVNPMSNPGLRFQSDLPEVEEKIWKWIVSTFFE